MNIDRVQKDEVTLELKAHEFVSFEQDYETGKIRIIMNAKQAWRAGRELVRVAE